MPRKPQMSRFHIHDDLSAPEGSAPILKGASAGAGQVPNFLGALAGSTAALRAYIRFRAELRKGVLTSAETERIALAVAAYYESKPGLSLHGRAARRAGLGLDEVALAERWDSRSPAQAALLRYLKPLLTDRARSPQYLLEEAREAGWSDEHLLEATAVLALESFTAMVNVAGEVPVDGSAEETRTLRAA